MKLPYGMSNFAAIRRGGLYYIDKTRFIAELESAELGSRYLMLLRPRRFGKSLWVSTLAHYYDEAFAESFDDLFEGLWIHEHPTPECGRHLVLAFDFSPVAASRDTAAVERSFNALVATTLTGFLARYERLGSAFSRLRDRIADFPDAATMIQAAFGAALEVGKTIYLLIDEYDSVANDLLARGHVQTYDELYLNTGFMRTFYKALKAGTQSGAVARVFITGITPVPLDDMASAFNILTQISHSPRFNEVCGFTREEVAAAVDTLLSERPELGPREVLLEDLERYYDGYRFSRRARASVYNSDMVLYYLRHLNEWEEPPSNMLDENVRTDYTKLRSLASPPGGSQDWHLKFISDLLVEGEVTGDLAERFNRRTMYDQQHLLSLLYHMGLVTIHGVVLNQYRFSVPNLVIRYMHWEELALLLEQQGGAKVRTSAIERAMVALAVEGDPGPFLALLRDQVLEKLSNRDLIRFDEKHLKLILLTYLTLSPIYRPLSEQEFRHGYADLFLGLDRRFPDAKYAWLFELKHLKAGSSEGDVARAREASREQIGRYLTDPGALQVLMGKRAVRAATVLLVGSTDLRWWVEQEIPAP